MRFLLLMTLSCLVLSSCPARFIEAEQSTEQEYAERRKEMVDLQLRRRSIRNQRVLEAMEKVPRHLFMPREVRNHAYRDSPVPIGEEQTISQPYIVALMTQLADPGAGDRALEVGTGSGYQAAVLAELVAEVYTIEIIPSLASRAAATFAELGYLNIYPKQGDGYQGWPAAAPFDIILVTAAAEKIPPPLVEQLGEGGRLIMPVGKVGGIQNLILLRRQQGGIRETYITDVRFVPLTGEAQRPD